MNFIVYEERSIKLLRYGDVELMVYWYNFKLIKVT